MLRGPLEGQHPDRLHQGTCGELDDMAMVVLALRSRQQPDMGKAECTDSKRSRVWYSNGQVGNNGQKSVSQRRFEGKVV